MTDDIEAEAISVEAALGQLLAEGFIEMKIDERGVAHFRRTSRETREPLA
jgi:hypothetical protein